MQIVRFFKRLLALPQTRSAWMRALALGLMMAAVLPARSDSVGQVQTTKFFAPETVTLLKSRLTNNTPGFVVGDLVSYIIQFTPVPNHSYVGAGGYITDYIPSGAEVVGAWFVEPNGSGDYRVIPPPSPALMADGWGARGQASYTGVPGGTNWTTTDAYTVSACTTGGLTACNGRLSEVYADTGIFYSTDPRTQINTYPDTDGRARQGVNGYYINPTGLEDTDYNDNLNTLLGQTDATVHNYWDAANVNAFGTETMPTKTPRATNLPVQQTTGGGFNGPGTGSSPFNAGSAVAGPDTGYKLDYSGNVGPWQRISYPGSMVGTNAAGRATATGTNTVAGTSTSAGRILSTSNPLPSNTNAVRWAAGNLTVGVVSHVKITLRLTAPVPATGLINNSEVFGGDSSPVGTNFNDSGGTNITPGNRESAWRYTVPSVADNNSNLLITKDIVCVFSGTNCNPISGTVVPVNPKIRYRILYLNTGNSFQTNVVLKEQLPAKVAAAGNLYVLSGTDLRPSSPVLSVNSAAVGATRGANQTLTAIVGGGTVTFPPLVSLPPAMGGSFEIDVQYTAAAGSILSNVATIATSQVPDGARGTSSVLVDSAANLLISKSTSTPTVAPGGTATYTITVTNTGSAAATSIVVQDFLPAYETTNLAAKRMEYLSTSSVSGLTSVTAVVSRPATVSPYSGNANIQQVTWTFNGTNKTLAAGATLTFTFNARVGASMASATYYNDAIVTYNNGSSQPQTLNNRLNDAAPVVVTSPLTITKTVDCIYSGSVCNAYTGSEQVPANGKLRYKISYANTSAIAQTNVYVCDSLPTQITSYAAAVSTPGVAPTPSGPYSDSPSIGTRTNPANTACGLSGTTFSYTVIPSLAAGGSGTVYVDVLTNAASGSTLVNTAKIVSTESAGGATSTVYNSVRNEARLSISKMASTSSISPNGTVDYTISITNTGNAAATTMTVYDFLPYYLTPVDATKRFQYVTTTTSVTGGLSTVFAGTATAPTIAPYSSTGNQEQVSWYFGAQSLAAGATANITFRAKAGANIPVGTTVYTNDAQVVYSTGSSTATAYVSAAAPVTVATNLSIVKTIDCIYNTALSACNAYDGSGIVPVNGKIRYKMVYTNTGSTAQSNVYVCDTLPTQISGIGAVTTPSIAPTPSGNYLDSPSLGARTTTANALCVLSGGTTFNYPVIASLAGGASGTVYYDVQTNAASGAVVTNTGKVVSGYATGGVVSSVSATALSVPNVTISKTTSATKLAPGQTATYTITLTNAGSTKTTSLQVYDFLPYSGTTNNAALRFNYVSGSSTYSGGLPTPTITAVVSPTVVPYNSNTNQQQVLWDFGNYQMAAGATATITFNAVSGASMPAASYGNTGMTIFTGAAGSGSNAVIDTATVSLSSPPTIAKAFDAPKAVSVSGQTTLTFTLTNPNSFALTGGSFTDDFPAGTALAATTLGGTCSGDTLASRASTGATVFSTATVGHISIQVSGFTVPASSSCTVQVKVQGNSAGAKVNTSSVLSSTNVVNSTGTTSDTLNVYATPTVTKVFGTSTISASGTTTLSITLGNPAGNPGNLTGITVADVFPVSPGAMTVGSASTTNGCSGGSASLQGKTGAGAYGTVAVNNTAVQVSGLTLAAGTTCTVVVTITASASGTYANTTTVVTATGPIALTGLVSNTATLVVSALNPSLVYMKTVATITDPINGAVNPKYIPGAEVRYSIRVTNQGPGTVDNSSMILTDQIPLNTELFVGDFVTLGPIAFVNSTTPASGLSWTYTSLSSTTDDISFSNTAVPGPYVFNYTPVPSGQGYDSSVTAIRLNPKGTMAGASGGNNPYAEFQFKVRIK